MEKLLQISFPKDPEVVRGEFDAAKVQKMLKSIPSAKSKAPAKNGGNSGFRDFLK